MVNRNILIFFFLLTIANLLIYLNRNNGFEFVKQSAYSNLYPNTNKGISSISIEKDSTAIINLKGYPATAKWNILCNDVIVLQNQSLPVHFSLKENLNRYVLQSNDPSVKPIIIDLDYAPAELYKRSGNSAATNYEIRFCSVPFVTTDTASLNKWKDPLDHTDAVELDAVKKILADSLHIRPTDSTVNKVKIIGDYIYRSVRQCIGIPADSLLHYSAYKQFCLAKNGETKIWCANITNIFHLFASAAGIVSRNIGVAGQKGIFTTGLHSANESYLPETGEWAYTDITQNILLLTDSTGRIFNTVDLYHLKKLNQSGNIILYSAGDSTVIAGNYLNPDKKYVWGENEILYPYPYDPAVLYSLTNKFKRYISKSPWFEIYSERSGYDNWKFYFKIWLFYTWVVLGIIMLVTYLFHFKRDTD